MACGGATLSLPLPLPLLLLLLSCLLLGLAGALPTRSTGKELPKGSVERSLPVHRYNTLTDAVASKWRSTPTRSRSVPTSSQSTPTRTRSVPSRSQSTPTRTRSVPSRSQSTPTRTRSVQNPGIEHGPLPLVIPNDLGCTPHVRIAPNGTYSNATIIDIYNKDTQKFTPTQQNVTDMCSGLLSFGTRPYNFTISPSPPLLSGRGRGGGGGTLQRPSRPESLQNLGALGNERSEEEEEREGRAPPSQWGQIRRHDLYYSWAVALVCAHPLPTSSACSVRLGLVELVSREEAVLLFSSPANHYYPGVLVTNTRFHSTDSRYLLTHREGGGGGDSVLPFLSSEHSTATFLTPSPNNSSLWLTAPTTEAFDFQCNLTTGEGPSMLQFSGLNHSEFIFTKTVAVVTVDHANTVLDVSIAVNYTYFMSVDVNCSQGVVHFTEFAVENTTSFLSESERTQVKDVLQTMGEDAEGWAKFQRGSLSENHLYQALQHRCTLDPQGRGHRCNHGYDQRIRRGENNGREIPD